MSIDVMLFSKDKKKKKKDILGKLNLDAIVLHLKMRIPRQKCSKSWI